MEKNPTWQKNSLVYQIYPMSFKDSNDDGIGDIKGIIQKLPQLKEYGVDVIWLCPVYQSPMRDNGYDISDYRSINPIFGTEEDLINLIDEVHKHGLKIIMDLVVNHTSDQHPWFKEALKDKNSKYRDYYIFRKKDYPKIDSVFSNSAWEYHQETQEYYFHLFDKTQPDLNWQNPQVRQEIFNIINYWLDKKIDGFRMDVIELIGKDIDKGMIADGPYLEEYLNQIYENCFKKRDILTVGETGGISPQRASQLTDNPKLGLNMAFQFSHLGIDQEEGKSKWDLKDYQPINLKKALINVARIFDQKGWNALFLSNHDQVRQITRFGNPSYPTQSASVLFFITYLQKGTPFLYMGEEIAMTGIEFNDISKYKDVETINYYHQAIKDGISKDQILKSINKKGRDNSRTPYQWDQTKYAGFSNNEPWLDVNPNYKKYNLVKQKKDKNSLYNFTKKMFQIRKQYQVFTNGSFKVIEENCPHSFIFERENQTTKIVVITNMTDKLIYKDLSKYQDYTVLLSNYSIKPSSNSKLKPYLASILIKEKKHDN